MMFERGQNWLLHVLRVPPQPAPPAGAAGSLRIFRAGKNFLRLKLAAWSVAQIGAMVGLLFSFYFVREVEIQIQMEKAREEQAEANAPEVEVKPVIKEVEEGVYKTETPPKAPEGWDAKGAMGRDVVHQVFHNVAPWWLRDMARRTPEKVLRWIRLGEWMGLVAFVVQFGWTLAAVWLDYTQRWYMVTDRSLRLRSGLVRIQEATMSFANLQQVSVHQGPLQRLLNLADVHVESAGGGSGNRHEEAGDSMHKSSFHAVENATEIRDLILARLQHFRQAGLGEPDDVNEVPKVALEAFPREIDEGTVSKVNSVVLDAAREVLAEVRALRESING